MLKMHSDLPVEIEDAATSVIGCMITVHGILGPGFKELIYKRALCLELESQGVGFECEKQILVPYKKWQIPGHTADLIVSGLLLVELKVRRLKDVHRRQVVSYLRATNLRLGLLVNFNVPVLKGNIRRVVR